MKLIQFPVLNENEKASRRNLRQEEELKDQRRVIEKLKQRLREK